MGKHNKSAGARKSSAARLSQTTQKPYPGFPLTWHPTGRWCKKIRGTIHYFGSDADAALELFNQQWPHLKTGRTPPVTRVRKNSSAEKPYPGFPLTPHPSGRWCKKIRGKLHYFGKLAEPDKALEEFNRQWPYLKDGRTPPPIDTGDGCTVKALVNMFLEEKHGKIESGELSQRTFLDYFATCELLADEFGRDRRVDDLRPDDFAALRSKLAKKSPVTLRNTINRIRVVLKYAFDQRLIDRPVHYGQSFDRPSAKTLRKARHAAGQRIFEADELRRIFDALEGKEFTVEGEEKPKTLTADPALKAMVILGLNCGFGNTDCATLPKSAIDFKTGWINYPRPKTGIERRIPLWPETAAALREAIAVRAKAKDGADDALTFLTSKGTRWVRTQKWSDKKRKQIEKKGRAIMEGSDVVVLDALSQRFAKLLKSLGINGHRGFYTLRHCFETVAGESRDQIAVDSCMGHCDSSMGAVYRERISDERLRAVTSTVHAWLGLTVTDGR